MKFTTARAAIATMLLATLGMASHAQTTASGASTAAAQANTAPIVFNPTIEASQPLARTETKTEIKSYTAPTAPTAYGAVGGAGCPAIDAKSLAVFFANGSVATPIELPGCMGLQLAALLLNPNMAIADSGEISAKTAAVLEAQCDFPQYRKAISRMGLKRDGKAWVCADDTRATTLAAAPAASPNANRYSSDPLIAERQRKAGL